MSRLLCPVAILVALSAAGCGGEQSDKSAAEREIAASEAVVYIADRDGGRVVSVERETLVEREVGALSNVNEPTAVALGPDGVLYATDMFHSAVVRASASGAERVFGDGTWLEEPVSLAFFSDVGAAGRFGGLSTSARMTDPSSGIVVLGNDTRNAVVLSLNGEFEREFGYPHLRDAHDIALGPDGYAYVATSFAVGHAGVVQVWDVEQDELIGELVDATMVPLATSIAFSSDGALLVADYKNGRVVRVYVELPSAWTVGGLSSDAEPTVIAENFDGPLSIAAASDGTVFVADKSGVIELSESGRRQLYQAASSSFVRGVSLGAAVDASGRALPAREPPTSE